MRKRDIPKIHRKSLVISFLLWQTIYTFAQSPYGLEPLAHTYSIVARDKVTGEMGVAVQSHWFSVGTIVSWGEAGVGVIATQSFVNPSFGPRGLALLKAGLTAQQALDALIESDEGRAVRQLAILDVKGNVAAYTGSNCIPSAGHQKGDNYSVQANLMRNDKVWPAMAQAFGASQGPLAERLLIAMEAGEAAGGDIRGRQSIAILVVAAKSTNQPWLDRKVDLQIADHADPLGEMRRLLNVHTAYEYMNRGDLAMELGDVDAALISYGTAETLFPENEEMQYWHAVSLANIGKLNDALPIFKNVFGKNQDWKELTPRIVQVGLLKVTQADLQRIINN
ncbi:MAG TPA: DUF1028 domain-containing protein [Saprospiraceae bacterium]|nr:DUF1028 domain-containing protein [Saprospiraceae bacterium]